MKEEGSRYSSVYMHLLGAGLAFGRYKALENGTLGNQTPRTLYSTHSKDTTYTQMSREFWYSRKIHIFMISS